MIQVEEVVEGSFVAEDIYTLASCLCRQSDSGPQL